MGHRAGVRRLARWSAAALGAVRLLPNPLGAAAPALPPGPSPSDASGRRHRDPLHHRLEEIPAAAGRALTGERHIARDALSPLKLGALERLRARLRGAAPVDRYRRGAGQARARRPPAAE